MKYFSMFTGIGGFEYGIQQALPNAECVGYSEIDQYAIQTYERHFKHKNYGDATKIKADELPDFDLLCGGFPCQAFSIAGKRRGFEDTRGTLFFDIARILEVKRPKFILLENVKGLLNHNKGQTFSTIIQTLEELGYRTQWMVLNSKFFGVPQNRERVFIIGSLRGEPRPEILSFKGADGETNLNYIGAIMSEKNKQWLEDGKSFSRNFPQGQRVYGVNGCSSTLAGNAGGLGGKTGLYAVLTPDRENKRQNGRRFKDDGEEMFTITGQDIHGVCMGTITEAVGNRAGSSKEFLRSVDKIRQETMQIRRLTPKECERLQGFPDDWTEGVSDTQRYKQCGNAVTTKVIKSIVEQLIGGKFTQGATPSFNMGLEVPTSSPPKSPKATSPNPNIHRLRPNLKKCSRGNL